MFFRLLLFSIWFFRLWVRFGSVGTTSVGLKVVFLSGASLETVGLKSLLLPTQCDLWMQGISHSTKCESSLISSRAEMRRAAMRNLHLHTLSRSCFSASRSARWETLNSRPSFIKHEERIIRFGCSSFLTSPESDGAILVFDNTWPHPRGLIILGSNNSDPHVL